MGIYAVPDADKNYSQTLIWYCVYTLLADVFIMENLIGISVTLLVILGFMWLMGKCFESDLKDLEKTNPKYRKWLKDKYDI